MLSKTFLSTAAIAAVAVGGPIVRRGDWTNPKGGNTKIGISDHTIPYGTANPSDVVNALFDHCHDDGTCDPSFSIKSDYLTGNGNDPLAHGEVQVTVQDAQFHLWAKNGIIGSLKATMDKSYKVDHTSWTVPNSCVGSICPDDNKPNPIDQYTAPDQLNIQLSDKDGGFSGFIHVIMKPHIDKGDSGFCGNIVGLAGGLASTINGLFGAAVSLGNIICIVASV